MSDVQPTPGGAPVVPASAVPTADEVAALRDELGKLRAHNEELFKETKAAKK